jgi:VWFA-related protein
VVVHDAHGLPVGDLRKEDFRLFDRGKQRDISGFSIETRGGQPLAPQVESARSPTSNNTVAPANGLSPSAPSQRFLILMFDDLHLSASDLGQVQRAADRIVSASFSSDSDFAAVVSFSGLSSGLTRDKAKLRDAISKVHVRELYRHAGQGCPDIDYYMADLIVNKRDQAAFESAVEETMSCAHLTADMRPVAEGMTRTASTQVLSTGDQDMRVTLGAVKEVVSKMAGLPGQRLLVLISPGFLTVTMEAMSRKSQILDLAARSNVTISALDARGLYVGGPDLSKSPNSTTYAQISGQAARQQLDRGEYADALAEFADGTGGTFVHNNNDLEGGLRRLAAPPEYVYLLEISLQDVKSDGTYHLLKVKVAKPGMDVQARRGYVAPAPASGKNR